MIRIALLTGPPFTGKTTIALRIRKELGVKVLENDEEIMKPCFDRLAPGQHLHQSIRPLTRWRHLRPQIDEHYQQEHFNWFQKENCPTHFAAVGWIYSRKEWRDMVGDAFSRSNLATQVCLFVLRLSASEYFRRFDKAQWERFGGAYGYKDQTGDQRRRRAAKLQDEFLHSDLEIPVNGVVPVIECRDDDMLLEEMQSFFTNTSQFE